MEISSKDLFLFASVAVTFVLGIANLIYNLKAGNRAAFVNTVTSERIKWISKVRENISILCSLCDQFMTNHQQETSELRRKIEQLKCEIILQLNPKDPEDQDIGRIIARLPSWNQSMTPEDYLKLQVELIAASQILLKREWDKVKDESIRGDLRSSMQWHRIVNLKSYLQ